MPDFTIDDITPEMIEAGVEAVCSFDMPLYDVSDRELRSILRVAFVAMMNARDEPRRLRLEDIPRTEEEPPIGPMVAGLIGRS